MKKLQDYSWPGNVRELANVIERAVINSRSSVLEYTEQFEQQQPAVLSKSTRTLEQMEKEYIISILEDTDWQIEGPNGAATVLGLNPSTLRTRMVKLGIPKSLRTFAGNARNQQAAENSLNAEAPI
jgi:transcriptional regulator with GAF, ATPase, and Fis domain